jgi:hypothetical protein
LRLQIDMTTICSLAVTFTLLGTLGSSAAASERTRRPFTVSDDIELALFHGENRPVRFSPDGKYFAVYYERGRLDLNRLEDSVRFYRSQDVKAFLQSPLEGQPPSSMWVLTRSTSKEGPIISDWRWLADSSGVAFLERTDSGNQRLMLANIRTATVEPLTPEIETVKKFDIRDRSHYVFAVADSTELRNRRAEREKPAIVGTGRDFEELLFPDNELVIRARLQLRSRLWAAVGGKPFEVGHTNAEFAEIGGGNATLALSPDGRQIVTALRVPGVPSSWKTLYWPSSAGAQSWVRAGGPINQYVLIDLKTGSVRPLTDAPTASWWWQDGNPNWSADGRTILLPNTFVKSKENLPTRPCDALVNLSTNSLICVEESKRNVDRPNETDGLEVTVKQGLNQPPLLIATDRRASRVIWDPNPQLKEIELGQANVYTWEDKEGREWEGGLYKPTAYKPGQRYPLVIQTHGFTESEFVPAGNPSTTGYAARELAAAGIIVLQVAEEPAHCGVGWVSPSSGSCAVSGYESAVNQLVSEGLVEAGRIGIMGFSATCFSVMEVLTTTSSLHVRAAVLNDGSTHGYLTYLTVEAAGGAELETTMGARPFGEGLQQWLKRAPDFKLDKITAPLLVVAAGPTRLLQWLWEPYAGLRYLHKPVDLILLNTNEHDLVEANPAIRMVSQGGSLDWFRFWLQDHEDLDPAKAEQYVRWRELRRLQRQDDANSKVAPPNW